MDNFNALFSLGRGGRANDTTQGGRNDGNEQGGRVDGNVGTTGGQRRTTVGFTDWDDTSMPLHGDDPSAPDVDARFGRGGEQTGTNVFALGGGGGRREDDTGAAAPPREITQLSQWTTPNERGDEMGEEHPLAGANVGQKPAPYSGLATAIARGGVGTPATIPHELNWQRLVDGEPAKINQWKDIMGSIQDFKAYLFVKPGSCFATVVHSPMKFAAISSATSHLQGRVIGFVGDRTATREPSPILFPTIKTWQWVKETVHTDGPALIKHYDDDPTRIGTLWKGEGADEDEKRELHAPRLLAIPMWLLDRIRQEGRALMPYEIARIVANHIDEVNDAAYGAAWATIVGWCFLASQGNATGESLLVSFSIEAITEVEDEYLGRWLEQRLDTTLGPRPRVGGITGGTTQHGPSGPIVQATLAADIGKGVALGLRALGGPMAAAQAQSPTKEGEEKTRYSDDDIAAIMGFSHVHRGDQVQPIWTTLNNGKQKNFDIFRRQLLTRMNDWSYQRRIPIDTGVFLDVDLVKAIVKLKFNPGEGVAHLNSAAKGLSILACRARTSGEIERQKDREEALTATEKTRQLDEFLRLQKDQR